jgi:hypothetical protein
MSFWSKLISPSLSVSIHKHLCTCERERERERECVCVCACVRACARVRAHLCLIIIWQARRRVFVCNGLLLCAENWTVGFNHYKLKGKDVKLFLCLSYEGVWGSWCADPCILDHGTNWRWVVSFTPHLLYPWYQSGRCEEEQYLASTGTRTLFPWLPSL